MRKPNPVAAAALLLAAVLAAPAAGARSEAELRSCLRANLERDALVQDLRIEQLDASGGTRVLMGRWWWAKAGDRSRGVMQLNAPADLSGAAYLMRRDGATQKLWMYLPAVGKAREVQGAAVAQSLFGSGLSAFDLAFVVDGLAGGTLSPLGATSSNGRAAERWRFLPKPDPDALYDRADLIVDNEWCLPLETQLFGGVPWKVLTLDLSAVRREGSRWFAPRATLVDLRASTRATITVADLPGVVGADDARFKPDRFWRAQ